VCEACASSTYQEQSAQSSCLKCSESSCTNVGGTGKGGYSTCGNATTGACVLCVPGKYLSGISCKTCASAKFQNKSGMANCETCPPGKGPCLGIQPRFLFELLPCREISASGRSQLLRSMSGRLLRRRNSRPNISTDTAADNAANFFPHRTCVFSYTAAHSSHRRALLCSNGITNEFANCCDSVGGSDWTRHLHNCGWRPLYSRH
jgi:hypothetical protein